MITEATGPLGQVTRLVTANETLVAGVAGEKIRLIGITLVAVTACTFRLVSGANVYVAPVTLAIRDNYLLPPTGLGWFDVIADGDLDIAITGSASLVIRYQRIK